MAQHDTEHINAKLAKHTLFLHVIVTCLPGIEIFWVNLFIVVFLGQLCGGGYLASLETRGCHLLIPTRDINNGGSIGKNLGTNNIFSSIS